MAKRPRFSRWRRLPPVFRSGEHRPIGSGNELDRIILYLPSRLLDLAEALAEKAGVAAVQDYCSRLLARALEAEQVQQKVAQFEARRGPLEGLKEIAEDADYLAEWQAQSDVKSEPAPRAIGRYALNPARPCPTRERPSRLTSSWPMETMRRWNHQSKGLRARWSRKPPMRTARIAVGARCRAASRRRSQSRRPPSQRYAW